MKIISLLFKGLIWMLGLVICSSAVAQTSSSHIRNHIEFLADDSLQGRLVGSPSEILAAEYIQKKFEENGLTPLLGEDYILPFEFSVADNPHHITPCKGDKKGHNVVGYLNNDANKAIVLGAHFDHLGHNEYRNSLSTDSTDLIHNGADDNASGVAMLLQLAEDLANNGIKEKVNFIFTAFSGEEIGLIGSKKLAPLLDSMLDIHMMINMDMLGRLERGKLKILGVGTAPNFVEILESYDRDLFEFHMDSSGVGPSDHTSFYFEEIPVLAFHTGLHGDYHKPSDDVEKINFEGLECLRSLLLRIIIRLSTIPELEFLETKMTDREVPKFKVTLGIFPNYTDYGDGLHITEVIADRPASNAGLKAGDIITQIGDQKISEIYSYMEALSKIKPGETYQVYYMRNGKPNQIKINF